MTAKRTSSWVACECDTTPCVCYMPPPRIGPTDRAEAEQLQAEMAESAPTVRAWLTEFLEQHGDELAEAMQRPTEDLIREALAAVNDPTKEIARMLKPTDTETFEAVADALVEIGASDRIKTHILAATMDVVGVPMLSVQRYRGDAAIVALFKERGVLLVDRGRRR